MVLSLLVATVVFVASILAYAMATKLIVDLVVHLTKTGSSFLGFWKGVGVMMLISLITAAAHLAPMALWAVVLLLCGELASFSQAFYCSAQNYTALGYGDVHLSERWQLLGPLEAVNGLLLFGLSTAVMFAVLNRLITGRLHHGVDHANKPKSG